VWSISNAVVVSNVFIDCEIPICSTSSEDAVIMNNTFIDTDKFFFQWPSVSGSICPEYNLGSSNMIIKNNIWVTPRTEGAYATLGTSHRPHYMDNQWGDISVSGGVPDTAVDVASNLWWTPAGTTFNGTHYAQTTTPNLSWTSDYGEDPLLTDYAGGDYSLDAGSSANARTGGVALHAQGLLDVNGVPFEVGNIGAYSYVTVGGNTAPVAVDDDPGAAYTVNEGATLTIADGVTDVLNNDTDADGDALTAILFVQTQYDADGTALASNGSFVYEHDGSETTTDAFTYHANDGTINSPSTATVTITITPVNDGLATAVHDDPGALYTLSQGATLSIADAADGCLANDTDPDGDTLTAVLSGDVSNGTLQLNPDGTFVYTHDGSANFSDSFTYYAHDGTGNSAATATVTLNINAEACSAAR